MTNEQRYTGELHIDRRDREYLVLNDQFSQPIPVYDIYSIPEGVDDGDPVTFAVDEQTAGQRERYPVAVDIRAADD